MSVRRNKPCPCGSGLKHKKCCEGADAFNAAAKAAEEAMLKRAREQMAGRRAFNPYIAMFAAAIISSPTTRR